MSRNEDLLASIEGLSNSVSLKVKNHLKKFERGGIDSLVNRYVDKYFFSQNSSQYSFEFMRYISTLPESKTNMVVRKFLNGNKKILDKDDFKKRIKFQVEVYVSLIISQDKDFDETRFMVIRDIVGRYKDLLYHGERDSTKVTNSTVKASTSAGLFGVLKGIFGK